MTGQRLTDRNAVSQSPHPNRAVTAPADDNRSAIREPPKRHRHHFTVVAGQRLTDRDTVQLSRLIWTVPCANCRRRC